MKKFSIVVLTALTSAIMMAGMAAAHGGHPHPTGDPGDQATFVR